MQKEKQQFKKVDNTKLRFESLEEITHRLHDIKTRLDFDQLRANLIFDRDQSTLEMHTVYFDKSKRYGIMLTLVKHGETCEAHELKAFPFVFNQYAGICTRFIDRAITITGEKISCPA